MIFEGSVSKPNKPWLSPAAIFSRMEEQIMK